MSGFNGGGTTPLRDPGAHNKNGSRDSEIHRHRIEIENMASLAMGHLPSQILITRDQRGVADALSAKLQSLGVRSIFVDEGRNEEIRNVDTALIHLAPLGRRGDTGQRPGPIGMGHIDTFVWKDFDTNSDLQFQTFVTVSALDGAHGFSGGDLNSAAAGAHGVAMSYGRERPNVIIRQSI